MEVYIIVVTHQKAYCIDCPDSRNPPTDFFLVLNLERKSFPALWIKHIKLYGLNFGVTDSP